MTTPHDAPTLFGIDLSLDALVSDAIKLLRTCEPKDRPYHLCQSGGKDSACIEALAKMSGVRYESHHNLTTIDPPELIWHLRRNYPDTRINKPPMGFFRFAIEHKYGFPTRRARFLQSL